MEAAISIQTSRIYLDNDLSRIGKSLLSPPIILRVLSARYYSVFASIILLASLLAAQKGTGTGTWRSLFWAANRFCSLPHQRIETFGPLKARTSHLFRPPPPCSSN